MPHNIWGSYNQIWAPIIKGSYQLILFIFINAFFFISAPPFVLIIGPGLLYLNIYPVIVARGLTIRVVILSNPLRIIEVE